MQTIPLIELSAAANTTRQIEKACRDIGFMYITGHGIAPKTIARVQAAVIDYFALPLEVKVGDRISRDNYRGYIPAGFLVPTVAMASQTATKAINFTTRCGRMNPFVRRANCMVRTGGPKGRSISNEPYSTTGTSVIASRLCCSGRWPRFWVSRRTGFCNFLKCR